jgi:hypothetical protein
LEHHANLDAEYVRFSHLQVLDRPGLRQAHIFYQHCGIEYGFCVASSTSTRCERCLYDPMQIIGDGLRMEAPHHGKYFVNQFFKHLVGWKEQKRT